MQTGIICLVDDLQVGRQCTKKAAHTRFALSKIALMHDVRRKLSSNVAVIRNGTAKFKEDRAQEMRVTELEAQLTARGKASSPTRRRPGQAGVVG
jgi:hypothetical protein